MRCLVIHEVHRWIVICSRRMCHRHCIPPAAPRLAVGGESEHAGIYAPEWPRAHEGSRLGGRYSPAVDCRRVPSSVGAPPSHGRKHPFISNRKKFFDRPAYYRVCVQVDGAMEWRAKRQLRLGLPRMPAARYGGCNNFCAKSMVGCYHFSATQRPARARNNYHIAVIPLAKAVERHRQHFAVRRRCQEVKHAASYSCVGHTKSCRLNSLSIFFVMAAFR